MKKLRFVILFAIVIQSSCKQSSKEYYTDLKRKEIYFSSFAEGDDVFWLGNDGQQLAKIEKGEYHFESLESNARYNAPEFAVKPDQNFEIEASMTGADEDSLGYYGIVIGQTKDSTFVDFKINNSGAYVLETPYPIASGKFDKPESNTYKKLTVRKLGNRLFFFINENIKYSYPVDNFINLRAGPITAPNSGVWIDYFAVNELVD